MKLAVITPLMLIVDSDDIQALRAGDASGAFGILPGHADFLTVLSASVVSWRARDGHEHHLAVRGGTLEVHGGRSITIATPEAIASEDLGQLESRVLERFRREAEQERTARTDAQKLYIAAVREISRLLRPERPATLLGLSAASGPQDRA